jgi:PKD repeat protein
LVRFKSEGRFSIVMDRRHLIFLNVIIGLNFFVAKPLPAQIKKAGIPVSFTITEKSATIIPASTLDPIYPSKLVDDDLKSGIVNRIGVVKPVEIDIKTDGVRTIIKNRGTIWRYQLNSPDCYAMGINFKLFNLPPNASLFVYNPSKTALAGAFSDINNKDDSQLTLADFDGNAAVIEYFEPDSVDFKGELVIGSVSLAYRNLHEINQSRIGINCPLGDEWQVEKNSVCLMTYNDARYEYFCTGSLVNNVREDGTPYFLTANHCISTNSLARTLITYFNYENKLCNSNDAELSNSLSGASLKASSSSSDFSLLLLSEYPPYSYRPFFSGWDATGRNPENGTCIHHPEGTTKCISSDKDKIADNDIQISWDDKSVSGLYSHWVVSFDEGNIESGSSGSPLFDQNKRIVGQLHGGDTLESYFGKLSVSWASTSNSAKQLKTWLDPDNSGLKILDGIGTMASPKARFISQMTEACTNNPVQLVDKSLYTPDKWLWRISPETFQFVENTNSSSQNPVVEFKSENRYTVELIASNSFGADSLIVVNYIDARENLLVGFKIDKKDTTICGCDLENFPFVAFGANTYRFDVSEKSFLITESHSDTLLLNLNNKIPFAGSFDTWLKVTGIHGSCTATDSILLHVIQQKNDNAANALGLHLGRNSSFSNRCGSVEKNEPSPFSGNCYSQVSWCSGEIGSNGNLDNSIWFTFYGPSSGVITIDSQGFDDQIAVYKSKSDSKEFKSFDDLDQIAANDNRSSSDMTAYIRDLKVEPGMKYWVQLDGRNGNYGIATIDLISNSVEVYPTYSSTGLFNIYISDNVDGTADYSVFTITGKKILSGSSLITIENNVVELDLSFYPHGTYLLKIIKGEISSVHKLVID